MQQCKLKNIKNLKLKFPPPPDTISKEAKHFIQSFLTLDPTKRINLEQIPNHKFIEKHLDFLQTIKFFDIVLPQKKNNPKRRRVRRKKGESDPKRRKLNGVNETTEQKREYIVIE